MTEYKGDYHIAVYDIVADTLQVPEVFSEDMFSELQVSSILLLRILSRIEEELQVTVDIVDLLLAESVGELADLAKNNASS